MKVADRATAETTALANLPDAEIDTSDIPDSADWTDAVRRRFHRTGVSPKKAVSPKRMSDGQRSEIHRLLLQGMDRDAIAEQVGVTPGQVSAIRAWMKMQDLPTTGAETKEIVEAVETTFGLERDLQQALRRNIAELEPGLMIVDGDRERKVKSGGLIDILGKDRSGGTVVIELKAGRVDRDAIGQILAYMGDLMEEAASVRGILVAAEFSPSTLAEAKAAPNITLVRYGVQFSFNPIAAHEA